MTSLGPYIEIADIKHKYTFSNIKKDIILDNESISGILSNGSYTKFLYIVKKANMLDILNNSVSEYTLFAPTDENIKDISLKFIQDNLDILLCRKIVLGSLLDKKLYSRYLLFCKSGFYKTKNNTKLFINFKNNIFELNNDIKILKLDIKTSNGVIHNIDNIISPYNFTN